MPTPSRGYSGIISTYKIKINEHQRDLPVPTVSTITSVIEVYMTVFDCQCAMQSHNTLPYLSIRHLSSIKGHTVWCKRCSALVSGRTHYGLLKLQSTVESSNQVQRILHLKLTRVIGLDINLS